MKRLSLLLAVLLAAAGALTACSGGPTNTPTVPAASTSAANYTNVSPSQLNAMLANKDFLLVNVHIPYYGELAQTDLFIPYNTIGDSLTLLPDKQAKIVLYCRSGSMSTIAANTLVGAGYTNVFNLEGGMYAWQTAGYQLIQKPQ